MVFRLDRLGRGGDHRPFVEAGLPAVRFTEPLENYDHEHQTPRVENGREYGDLVKFLNFEFLGNVARANAETLRQLALAPAAPGDVTVSGGVTPDAKIAWSAEEDGEREGFEILWRETTDPRWSLYGLVPSAGESVLKGVSTDNHFFAVRSVGKNGARSIPVAAVLKAPDAPKPVNGRALRAGSAILTVAAAGILGASFAILSPRPNPWSSSGRHLWAGALANASVALLLIAIAAVPLRRGEKWAFWAYLIPIARLRPADRDPRHPLRAEGHSREDAGAAAGRPRRRRRGPRALRDGSLRREAALKRGFVSGFRFQVSGSLVELETWNLKPSRSGGAGTPSSARRRIRSRRGRSPRAPSPDARRPRCRGAPRQRPAGRIP